MDMRVYMCAWFAIYARWVIEGACFGVADLGGKYTVVGVRGDTYAIESCSWGRADSWEDVFKKGREVLKSRLVDEYMEKATNKVGNILDFL